MMKILCKIKGCNQMFDSVLEIHIHRVESHYQHFFELVNGNEKLLQRYMNVMR